MSRMNRRRFTWVATSGFASAALVACGGDAVDDDLEPTRIADVGGAPPTLAPNATPFSSDAGDDTGGAAPVAAGEAVTVQALDSLAFDPDAFTAAPGQEIHLVNAGVLQHDLLIDELGIGTDLLNGGDEQTITVPDDAAPGEYVYYCSVPGHREAGMEGTLTVAEGGGEEAASEEGGEEAAAGGEPITVTGADSLSFDPDSFEATPGQEIHFVNGGVLQHDLLIDELGIGTDLLNGGEEQTITVPDDAAPGEYVYYCSVPGHREAGMEGTLTVVEAAAAPAEEEEAPEEETEASPAAASSGGGGEAIEVHTLDTLKFDPPELTVSPGQEIHVVNEGVMPHDFVIDELDMATDMLNGGDEQTITVPDAAEPGEYTYYCSVPGHRQAGMEGTLTVE